MKQNRKLFLRVLALVLAGMILLLDILFFAFKDQESSQVENRNLQQFPTLSWHAITSGRAETEFEDYVADQFPFRTAWVRLKSTVDRLLGKTEANGIFLARSGYLIQDFTPPEEEIYTETISAMTDFARSHPDLSCCALIAPTALTVYKNKLPVGAVTGDENGFLDRVAGDLAGSGITFVDVRETLAANAKEEQLYYRTDHHWTTQGAWLAYQDYARAAGLTGGGTIYEPVQISDSFQGTLTASSGLRMGETDPLYVYLPQGQEQEYLVTYEEEGTQSRSCYVTDCLNQRDQYALFFGGNYARVTIHTKAESDQVLLVLKDSYANCFVPFLLEDYKEIVMVDPRYFSDELELVLAAEEVTDVLFLYNANTLASDTNLAPVLEEGF